MTLTSTIYRVQYSGDGSTVSFPITFVFWDNSDIEVIHTATDGVTETTWSLGSQYTLSGGSGSTGTLTVSTSPTDYTPASGETLTIQSNLTNTQGTDIPLGGEFSSVDVEQQLDKFARMFQQLEGKISRAMIVRVAETTIGDLPRATDRASKFLAFNTSGDPIASPGDAGSVAVSAAMEAVLEAATLALARTALGLGDAAEGDIGTDVQAYDAGISNTPLIQGTHTVGLGSGGLMPAETNGCAAITQTETTTNKVNYQYLAFNASTIEYAHFDFPSPKSYNASTMKFIVHWTHPATATNFGVVWTLELLALDDDNAIDTAYGTGIDITDTGGTTEDFYETAESAAVTPANTPAKKDRIFGRISRKATDGSDTLAVDAHLIGVTVLYTIDAGDDS